jgi:hypothetical protein
MICALDEHCLDYGALIAIARALREQIDWPSLRARTAISPYAVGFFALAESLGIAAIQGKAPRAGSSRVRVLPGRG